VLHTLSYPNYPSFGGVGCNLSYRKFGYRQSIKGVLGITRDLGGYRWGIEECNLRYTDEFRATSVIMLEANGYPDDSYALAKTAHYLHIPRFTLYRWYKRIQNPPPHELVTEIKKDFLDLIEDEMRNIFDQMKDANQDADYRELGTVLGILFDKRQLLTGGSTENVNFKGLVINLASDNQS